MLGLEFQVNDKIGEKMLKPIKSILFATNLSENCRPAFEMAASMAIRHEATLVLLHVLERVPDYVESRLKGMLGKQQYGDLVKRNSDSARQALIGKKSSGRIIHEALAQYCTDVGIDDASCGYQSREIVVTDGELVDEIISKAKEYHCELIVMGAREGFLSDNSIGHTIKSVMRQAKIPVMMVPPKEAKEE
jgi:nucleotide-binding universal stress UspA family protein